MPIATRNGSTRSKAEAPALLVWFLTSPFAGQPMVLFGACVQTPSQCFVLLVTFIERQRRQSPETSIPHTRSIWDLSCPRL